MANFFTGYIGAGSVVGDSFVECTASDYLRQPVTLGSLTSGGAISTETAVTFSTTAVGWGTIGAAALYTSATGGFPLIWWPLANISTVNASQQLTIGITDQTLTFAALNAPAQATTVSWNPGTVVGVTNGGLDVTAGGFDLVALGVLTPGPTGIPGTINIPPAGLVGSNGTALIPLATAGALTLANGTLTASASGVTVPNASLVGGNGTIFNGVALGTNLTLTSGTLNATGGASVPAAGIVYSNGTTEAPLVIGAGLAQSGGTISNTFSLTVPNASLLSGSAGALAAVALGTGLTLSAGTLSASTGGGGTVTSVIAAGLLTGGTITGAGTITLAAPSAGIVHSNGSALAPEVIGAGLTESSGTLSNSGLLAVGANLTNTAGTVTLGSGVALLASPAFTGTPTTPTPSAGDNSNTVADTAFVQAHTAVAGTGLAQSGNTLSLANIAASSLHGNAGTVAGVPVALAVGSGLTLSTAGTLSSTAGGGSVTSVVAGTGLAGGTITGAGTVSLATIAASSLFGNPGTAAAAPVALTVGSGLTLSTAGTLSASGGGNWSATAVSSVGSGLSITSGTISNSGLLAVGANLTNTAGTVTLGAGVALLASPALTGTPTAPTPSSGDNSTTLATTAFVQLHLPVAGTGITQSGVTLSANGNMVATNTYTASGTIAVTDTLAIVNAATTCAMTLAAGSTDGHRLVIKRFGAGTVTITLNLDGTSGAVVTANSGSIKESFDLTYNNAGTTWLAT